MSKEAMTLALEALAVKFSEGWHEGIKIDASDIMLLNDAAQALAEQPAQQEEPFAMKTHGAWDGLELLDDMPDGACLYTSPPAQQGQVAWTLLLTGENQGLVGKAGEKFVGAPEYYERVDVYTSPQRTWVGLTEQEHEKLRWQALEEDAGYTQLIQATEAKLREKNA